MTPVDLHHVIDGPADAPAVVLFPSLGSTLELWEPQVAALAEHFRVVRVDPRGHGGSPVPQGPYTIDEIGGDVVTLLDRLGIDRAHVVGVSLGGMVAQHLAIEHAPRVRSATSIMSSPGARRYMPEPRALRALLSPRPTTAEQAGEMLAELFHAIGSSVWPLDRERLRRIGRLAFERGVNPRGFVRQLAAVLASGDRRPELARTPVPVLAVHGSRDPMFPLAAGRALASIVPDGEWLPIQGMAHYMPSAVWPVIVRAIARHAARAERHLARKP